MHASRPPTESSLRTLATVTLLGLVASSAAAQVPCSTNSLGTNLGLGDETMSVAQTLGFTFTYGGVPYTQIQVCDNGYVTLGPTGGQPDYDPLAATLVSDPFPRICPLWIDLEPGVPGSGDVYFSAVPASGITPAYAVITWDGVYEYLGSTPHTIQLFLIDGGQIRCTYDSDLAANPAGVPWLIGASPGNNVAQNPVNFLSLPITTNGNPTLHEEGQGPVGVANRVLDWIADGIGGYLVVRNTTCAAAEPYGTGCLAEFGSFYEHFTTTPSIDLSNRAFELVYTGGGYTAITATTAFVTPSATATNLGLGDDDETTVALSAALPYPGGTTTSLNVCSNGHVSTASNGAAFDYTPTPAEFLGWPNATWAVWRDMIPTSTGPDNVWFEEVGGVAYITWLNVVGYVGTSPGTTPSTFQLQFHLASGTVDFVFGSLDTVSVSGWAGGEGWVVGFSPAGPSADPGSMDLTTALPVTTYATDVSPLTLSASVAPMVNTTIQLITTNIPTGAPFGAVMFGLATYNPGLNLAGIGMPGCFQYTDSLATLLFFPLGSSSVSTPFVVPNAPGLVLNAQGLAYAPAASPTTPLGALSSNGLALRIN